ncbi:MAG: hypothetical protein ACFFDT_08045 [Candidatus Hodarchaeota archaeon]
MPKDNKQEKTKRITFRGPTVYKTPIQSWLHIFKPGGGAEIVPAKEISAEELYVPIWKDKEEWERILFYGVHPDILVEENRNWFTKRYNKWQIRRMHYTREGWPFTFDPRTGRIWHDDRKRQLMLQRGVGAYLELENKRFIILLDQETGTPYLKDTPYTTELKQWLKDNHSELSTSAIKKWLESKKGDTSKVQIVNLPVVTEYDVSDIINMKSEVGETLKQDLNTDLAKAMKKAGKEGREMWLIISTFILIGFIIVAFLIAADQGAFARYG